MKQKDEIEMLVKRCQKGDRVAFDALTRCYQSRIKKYIKQKVNQEEQANDLTQEVFLQAFIAICSFRFEASFYTWLYQIAKNKIKQFYAQQKKYDDVFVSYSFEDLDTHFALNALTIEHLVYLDELAPRIDHIIKTLPKEYQQCLYLRDIEGLNYQEIACYLACPIGTVRSRLSRVRAVFNPDDLRFS